MLAGGAEALLFETVLSLLSKQGLLKRRGRKRTDSTHVLAAVQSLCRLELVGETMRATFNSLAVVAPDWLRACIPATWYERYAERIENYRLPDAATEREALGVQIGKDGFQLLNAVSATDAPAYLRAVPAVDLLRRVWLQQYYGPHRSKWRERADSPPTAQVICSPYDEEAAMAPNETRTGLATKCI